MWCLGQRPLKRRDNVKCATGAAEQTSNMTDTIVCHRQERCHTACPPPRLSRIEFLFPMAGLAVFENVFSRPSESGQSHGHPTRWCGMEHWRRRVWSRMSPEGGGEKPVPGAVAWTAGCMARPLSVLYFGEALTVQKRRWHPSKGRPPSRGLRLSTIPHQPQTHNASALVPSLPKIGLVIACHGRQTEPAVYRHAHPCCNILNAAAEFGCQRTRSRTNCQCQCHCLRVQRILPTSKALGVCGNVEPVASWAKIPADRPRRCRLGLPFGQRLERQDACAGPR